MSRRSHFIFSLAKLCRTLKDASVPCQHESTFSAGPHRLFIISTCWAVTVHLEEAEAMWCLMCKTSGTSAGGLSDFILKLSLAICSKECFPAFVRGLPDEMIHAVSWCYLDKKGSSCRQVQYKGSSQEVFG